MLVILSYHATETGLVAALLDWMLCLDGKQERHQLWLLASPQVSQVDSVALLLKAREAFTQVESKQLRFCPESDWPGPSNAMFRAAADWVRQRPQPFLWLEPDCTPVKSGWLDAIEDEYRGSGKPFMGALSDNTGPNVSIPHINGVAVWSLDMLKLAPLMLSPAHNLPFDVVQAKRVLANARATKLIQRSLPGKGRQSWTFPDPETVARVVKPETVLFHGCKDGTLIDQLGKDIRRYGVELPKSEATCFVCLGRYGDIMNALPLARRHFNQTQTKPFFMVATEFASILEGVGYVTPHIFNGHYSQMPLAMREAQGLYKEVVRCQVFGMPDGAAQLGPRYNVAAWIAAGEAYRWRDPEVALVFDNRSPVRERDLIDHHIRVEPKPILAVSLRAGNSSPFSQGADMTKRIVDTFGRDWQVIDLCDIVADRIYDMLGILEQASMLVTSDTAFVHLAAAVPWLPVYLLSQDKAWNRTEPRCKCVGRATYGTWIKEFPTLEICIKAASAYKVFHTFEVHPPSPREKRAQLTWPVLWEGFGWTPCPLKERYPRDARAIGDERALPYLKDIWKCGLDAADENDIILFTNSDIILLPGADCEIRAALARSPAVLFSRRDIEKFADVNGQATTATHQHFGRDAIAARAWWLRRHWQEIPDFVIGRSDWDTCMTCLVRKAQGCLIPGRWSQETACTVTATDAASLYMLHERHESANMRPAWGNKQALLPHAGNLWNHCRIVEWQQAHCPEMEFFWCQQSYDAWKSGQITFTPDAGRFRSLLRAIFK